MIMRPVVGGVGRWLEELQWLIGRLSWWIIRLVEVEKVGYERQCCFDCLVVIGAVPDSRGCFHPGPHELD